MGEQVKIKNKPLREIWEEENGWALTTLPSVYDVADLQEHIGFIPGIPLETAIRDAIRHYPKVIVEIDQIPVHRRMTLLPRPQKIDWLFERQYSKGG